MFDDKYLLGLLPKPAYEQQIKWEIESKFLTTNQRIAEACQEELAYWRSLGKTVPQKEAIPADPLTEEKERQLKELKEDFEFRKKQYDEGKWIPQIKEPTTFRIK